MVIKFVKIDSIALILIKSQIRFNCTKKNPSKLSATKNLNELLLKMPRDRKHILEAQQQRLKIKEKSTKYAPGTVNLQILGSGAFGSPASVYLFTDHTRYLFNCGEGTQRLAHEHKTKLSRLEHIFMTRTSWNRIGGLPGLSLTVQDAGVPELTLHGPNGLDELFRGMKRFVVLKNLRVNAVSCEEGGEYDDSVMNVKCIPIKRKSITVEQDGNNSLQTENNCDDTEMDNTDYYAYESKNSASGSPKQTTMPVITTKRHENSVILYVCKLKPRAGALNLEKCVVKGVPPGPLLGQLKNGIDITLSDGTLVRADDVRSATDPGPVFIFIDIPSEDYLESLQEANEILSDYQATSKDESKVASVVIHFSPENIIQTEIYQNLIDRFSPSTKHLVLNYSNRFSGNVAAHRIQWQLNQLNPYVFPVLREDISTVCIEPELMNSHKKPKLSNDDDGSEKSMPSISNDPITVTNNVSNLSLDNVKSLTCYHLRPRKGLDRDFEPKVNPLEYIQETQAVEGFTESLEKLKKIFEEYYKTKKVNRENDYPKIVFLGTGSCIPNKTRNVSSILLQTNKNSCILLDCGEGTFGQIIRYYGESKAMKILNQLKAVYISHLHADHHIGLIGILRARQQFCKNIPPIQLFAPKQILSWLYFYNQRIECINKEYILIPNDDMIKQSYSSSQLTEMSISSIITCLVSHCPFSYGVAININGENVNKSEPIKITYSGDTTPCDTLVNIGQNSTILIHEATMEDELIHEARFKLHSTTSQAIEQANRMNAKYTILTHFSQRYAKLPRIEENLVKKNCIGIAFDNMEVTCADLDFLHLMYPTLKSMFSEHCEDMDQKAFKRAMRKERKRQANTSVQN